MLEMKDMMLQQNEAIIRQLIARADDETTDINHSLQQLTAARTNEQDDVLKQSKESEQSKQELLQELEKQQAANAALKEMCEEDLSETVYERTGQKIKGVRATNNSSAITGSINTSGEESRIDQDISDVSADSWSIAVAGVIKNVDFKDLRPGGPDRGGRDDVRRKP